MSPPATSPVRQHIYTCTCSTSRWQVEKSHLYNQNKYKQPIVGIAKSVRHLSARRMAGVVEVELRCRSTAKVPADISPKFTDLEAISTTITQEMTN